MTSNKFIKIYAIGSHELLLYYYERMICDYNRLNFLVNKNKKELCRVNTYSRGGYSQVMHESKKLFNFYPFYQTCGSSINLI